MKYQHRTAPIVQHLVHVCCDSVGAVVNIYFVMEPPNDKLSSFITFATL